MVLVAGGEASGYMVLSGTPTQRIDDPVMRTIRGSGKIRAGFEGNVRGDKRSQNHQACRQWESFELLVRVF